MRRLYSKLPGIFLILCIPVFVNAQQIPNFGFEDWTLSTIYEEPQGYHTLNTYTALQGSPGTTKSTDSYSGTYAVKLTTTMAQGDTLPAMLFTGTLQNLSEGIPYSDHPDSVFIHAKYQLAANDTATGFFVFKAQTNVIGLAEMKFYGNATNYQKVSREIQWIVPGVNPDTAVMIFSCPDNQYSNGTPGSMLMIDNLNFGAGYANFPNADFESWNSFDNEKADHWFSINRFSNPGNPSLVKTTDSYEGNYAANIKTIETFYGDTMGILTCGRLGSMGPEGGFGVNQNPDIVSGYYKYSPNGQDTALAGVFSFVYDDVTDSMMVVDSNVIKLAPANSYTRFEIPLNYDNWPIVDTVNVIFASSNLMDGMAYAGIGSELTIDSLNIQYKPVGIEKHDGDQLSIYPNPASDRIEIDLGNKEYEQVVIYNVEGKQLKEIQVNNNNHLTVNSETFAPGMVFLRFTGKAESITRKLIIE